ncbi:unnamed protein product [Mesocestoides corti]|uniref:Cyclin N-terminal domain-containing protein n=1 Tax=Mesocestoides corti TaxID=53468 RepID=A0A0R3UM61_MESCO|nr:unnamed protein product [Mesocestoides corti]
MSDSPASSANTEEQRRGDSPFGRLHQKQSPAANAIDEGENRNFRKKTKAMPQCDLEVVKDDGLPAIQAFPSNAPRNLTGLNLRGSKKAKCIDSGINGNQRINRIFQITKKGVRQEPQRRSGVTKKRSLDEISEWSMEKENKNVIEKANSKCLEGIRMLMERQTLSVVERNASRTLIKPTRAKKVITIPKGTRLAFSIYNGTWIHKYPLIVDRLHINPLLEYKATDRGEFPLFYKRILHYLLIRDAQLSLDFEPNCLVRSGLSTNLRGILFDWMIKVQQYLQMRTESLHLAASFVDQFIWHLKIAKEDYQLVAITALFLAAKVNERVPVSLKTLCYLTEHSFEPDQVLELEITMLRVLNFKMNPTIPHTFLSFALMACNDLCDASIDKIRLMCLYLFDLCLPEFALCQFSSSLRCAAAVYLSRRLILSSAYPSRSIDSSQSSSPTSCVSTAAAPDLWTPKLAAFTGHHVSKSLKRVSLIYASMLAKMQLLLAAPDVNESTDGKDEWTFDAALLKYSSRKYGKVAQCSLFSNFNYSQLLEEWTLTFPSPP